jgi:predicted DNA-binding protein with PD1-like motif
MMEMLSGQVGRICFDRIAEDEDLAEAIRKRIEQGGIKAGFFVVIGSLKKAVLGYYKNGEYENITLPGPLEIASGIGNIALSQSGEVMVHTHLVVSNERGEAFGGHLMSNSPVGATAELVIVEGLGVDVIRGLDEKTRLNLLKLG